MGDSIITNFLASDLVLQRLGKGKVDYRVGVPFDFRGSLKGYWAARLPSSGCGLAVVGLVGIGSAP